MVETNTLRERLRWFGPAALVLVSSLALFVGLGGSPLVRAVAMAATVAVVTLTLRRFGAGLSLVGGLALAFSPGFWSQVEGMSAVGPEGVLLAAGLGLLGLVGLLVMRRPEAAVVGGAVIFAAAYWVAGGTRSLRVTLLLTAALLYLLFDALLTAHARPDEPPQQRVRRDQSANLLLVLCAGILNDPLFTLLAPAAGLGLFLSGTRLPRWHWAILVTALVVGMQGLVSTYAMSGWWAVPAEQIAALGVQAPFLVGDAWQDAGRWLNMLQLLASQFSVLGLAVAAFGLARLARWYPPLGLTTLVAFAGYFTFGLMYFGRDRVALLLPLLTLQVVWMTYAAAALAHWLHKAWASPRAAAWLVAAAYSVAPIALLVRIVTEGG